MSEGTEKTNCPVEDRTRCCSIGFGGKTNFLPTSNIQQEICQKNQVIRLVTQQLLDVSVPPIQQAVKKLEENYNPYHRVYFPFSSLFEQTNFPELGQNRLANCNSPHRQRIPELIMIQGFKINLNQILDNGNYYMRPVDRLAKDAGYEGAYIEDHGISFTIPIDQLTPKIQQLTADYDQLKQQFMLTSDQLKLSRSSFDGDPDQKDQKSGYAWRQRTTIREESSTPYYFKKKIYPNVVIPINYLHKLRRDLNQYYCQLGYGDSNKSCDIFYQKEQHQSVLKVLRTK